MLFTLFYKTSYLNEEVNCSEPSPSLSVPLLSYLWFDCRHGHGEQLERVSGDCGQLLTPGVNLIKLFFFVADDEAK
jgi:hypothetical protein